MDNGKGLVEKVHNALGFDGTYVSEHEYRIDLPDSDAYDRSYLAAGSIEGLNPESSEMTEKGLSSVYYDGEGDVLTLTADFDKDIYTAVVTDGSGKGTDGKKNND